MIRFTCQYLLNSLLVVIIAATYLLHSEKVLAQVSFAGETIEWISPFATGGGTDTWARFNAPFLEKYLPGNPTVVVINEPGGGSTRGANLFAMRARPDGLTVLGTSGSTQFPYLLGDPRVRYDYQDWEIVMVAPTGGVVYTTPKTGVRSVDDIALLRGQQLVYASQGATSLDLVPMLAFRLLGLDVRHVFGFTGRGTGRLAFERGETNIDYQTSSAYISNVIPLVELGEAVPLFSFGILDEDGNIVRDPTFPDIPTMEEVYENINGERPSGPEYEAYNAFNLAGFAAQKMLFLPEGTPPEIVEAWRDAYRRMRNDPEYIEARLSVLGEYEQQTDRPAATLFRKATTIPQDVRQLVLDLLQTEYNTRIGR